MPNRHMINFALQGARYSAQTAYHQTRKAGYKIDCVSGLRLSPRRIAKWRMVNARQELGHFRGLSIPRASQSTNLMWKKRQSPRFTAKSLSSSTGSTLLEGRESLQSSRPKVMLRPRHGDSGYFRTAIVSVSIRNLLLSTKLSRDELETRSKYQR